MIDPKNITNYNRTEAELQEFLLFCICVAGKNSHQQAKKLNQFLTDGYQSHQNVFNQSIKTPFKLVKMMGDLGILKGLLMLVKMGQYTRITNAFYEVSKLPSLTDITISELEKIKGIGPKTARFFVLHSRPNQQIAVLDTHILKWLQERAFVPVPKKTPSSKNTYLMWENVFLYHARELGMTPAELDLKIWKEKTLTT